METAIAYVRVSDPRQVTGTSLESQQDHVTTYVTGKAYALDRIFVEEGESAKTSNRKVLKEMLAYCKLHRGRIHVLVFPKIDRFARYTEDYHLLKRDLRVLGIRVESTDERFDDSPSGRYMENMLASTAQYDNELRAERCRGGMIDAARQGRWVFGKAPIGYRPCRHNSQPTIEPDPAVAPLIAEAFQSLASGRFSMTSVRRWLLGHGISVSKTRMYRLVHSKTYIGVIEAFGLNVSATTPFVGLVSETTFYKAQSAIRPKRSPRSYERHRADFPLRGTLTCPCGRLLTAAWAKGRTKAYPYYRCKACRAVNIRRESAHHGFRLELRKWQRRLSIPPALRQELLKAWSEERSQSQAKCEALNQEIRRLKSLQRAIALKNAEGVIPDDVAREQIGELARRIAQKHVALGDVESLSEDPEPVLQFAERFLLRLEEWWQHSPLDTQKHIQAFFYPEGATALPSGEIRTTKKTPSSGGDSTSGAGLYRTVDRGLERPNPVARRKQNDRVANAWETLHRLYMQFHPLESEKLASSSP